MECGEDRNGKAFPGLSSHQAPGGRIVPLGRSVLSDGSAFIAAPS